VTLMPLSRGLKSVISFLTIIPVRAGAEPLRDAALNMYLFPLVGAGLGFFVGLMGSFLTTFLPASLTTTVLTVTILYLATGLHHFDGLLDFGDGLMLRGQPEEKIAAMRDKPTGAGGLGLGLLNTLLLISCLWAIPAEKLIPVMIVSEASAKLTMVLGAVLGKPSSSGVGAVFIQTLTGKRGITTFAIATIFAITIAALALGMRGFLGLASALAVGGIIVQLSHRNFGCVTGDVLGSMNELARSLSLVVLVAIP